MENESIEKIKSEKEIKPFTKKGKIISFIALTLYYIALPFLLALFLFSEYQYFTIFLSIPVALLPFITEIVITKRKKVSRFFFLPTSFIAYLFYAVAMFFLGDEMTGYLLLMAATAIIVLRILITVIELIRMKKFKLIPLGVAGVIFTVSFSFLVSQVIYPWYEEKITDGEPDRLGSWSYINNNDFASDENWKQIVKDSPFKFGSVTYQEEYFRDIGTYPSLDGSTVCVPMAMEFAKQHLGMSKEESASFVRFDTTHYAYENLISNEGYYSYYYENGQYIEIRCNKTDLILATEPSEEELELAESKGVTLVKKPVCYDAFVFITHKDNPVDNLSSEQIRDIYSGKIKNWEDVGGEKQKIVAYQREENSGSQTAMENLVMGGRNMISPKKIKTIVNMGELVDAVAEYENNTSSLGYTYKYYIDNLYKNDNIKILSVDGVYPNDENVRNGSYPYTTNYYAVIRGGDEENTGGLFLDWILSKEGQKCIKQAGYIPIED